MVKIPYHYQQKPRESHQFHDIRSAIGPKRRWARGMALAADMYDGETRPIEGGI